MTLLPPVCCCKTSVRIRLTAPKKQRRLCTTHRRLLLLTRLPNPGHFYNSSPRAMRANKGASSIVKILIHRCSGGAFHALVMTSGRLVDTYSHVGRTARRRCKSHSCLQVPGPTNRAEMTLCGWMRAKAQKRGNAWPTCYLALPAHGIGHGMCWVVNRQCVGDFHVMQSSEVQFINVMP